jgi:DNA-binding transcriptional LysR family regulator
MDIELTKLNQLVVIARTGSFSRAAEELRITQPALSRSVAAIEQRYGFRIFERGRAGASPTAVGAMVLADAEALLRDARALQQNLHLYAQGDAGKVAIGMGPLIASLTLRNLATRLLTERPRLQLRCSVKSPDVLLAELMSGGVEMVFCATEPVPHTPEITIQPLGAITLALIVRAGHPLAASDPLTMAEVGSFPIAHSAHAAAEELHAAERFAGGALFCDNYEILHQVVLESDAVWMSSPEMGAEDLAAGRLIQLAVTDMPPRRSEVGVVRLKGRTNSPAANAVVTHVADLLAGPVRPPA